MRGRRQTCYSGLYCRRGNVVILLTLRGLGLLLGIVDDSLHLLCHSIHSVLSSRHPLVVAHLSNGHFAAASVELLVSTTTERLLARTHWALRRHTGLSLGLHGRLSLLQPHSFQTGHYTEVEVIVVRVVSSVGSVGVDELRDLDSGDEVLVALGHDVVVLCHPMDLCRFPSALILALFVLFDPGFDVLGEVGIGERQTLSAWYAMLPAWEGWEELR